MKRTWGGDPVDEVRRAEFGHVADLFETLSSALWRERELLETLLFALVTQQLVLGAGQTRWLFAADARVTAAVDRLREHELPRAMATDAVLIHLSLPASASLLELAAAADVPWTSILLDLHGAMRGLIDEIDAAVAGNETLLLAVRGPRPAPAPRSASCSE